jgi:prephenate dehydratase
MMTTALRVAYQGEPGAFSESAAHRLLGERLAAIPCKSFEEMFDSVERGDTDCCVAPIENSLAGSIHRNYDLLFQSRLTISGETNLRIVHNLIARPGSELPAIRRVYSHPVALAQCARFLNAHPGIEPVPVHDTAGAVRIVMERGQSDEAAIASDRAAEIYGAHILAESVEDHAKNYTRFFLLSHSAMDVQETPRRWKTSLVLQLRNEPGSLFRALGAFALPGIDLSKIESRPIEGRPWEYAFYLDIVGNRNDSAIARAIDNLTEMAEKVKILGSYPTRW